MEIKADIHIGAPENLSFSDTWCSIYTDNIFYTVKINQNLSTFNNNFITENYHKTCDRCLPKKTYSRKTKHIEIHKKTYCNVYYNSECKISYVDVNLSNNPHIACNLRHLQKQTPERNQQTTN